MIISVHFPKAAGTSLAGGFRQAFGEGKVLADYSDDPGDPTSRMRVDPEYILRDPPGIPPGIEVVHGHLHPNRYIHRTDAAFVTFLRHPVDTFISVICFTKTLPEGLSPLTTFCDRHHMGHIDRARLPVMRHLMSRTYFGDFDMRRFDFIGDASTYAGDLVRLSRILGRPIKAFRENSTLEREGTSRVDPIYENMRVDAKFRATLTDLFADDIRFYEKVQELRAEKSWTGSAEPEVKQGRGSVIEIHTKNAASVPDEAPVITIFTPTYNKAAYLREAGLSILQQTRKDWLWWVVLDGADEETTTVARELAAADRRVVVFEEKVENRYEKYRPAVLANKYFPLIGTKYFCWHSDDDLKEPGFIKMLVGELEANPEYHVAYGTCRGYFQNGSKWTFGRELPGNKKMKFGPGSPDSPRTQLDSGQFVQTKSSAMELAYVVPENFGEATQSDGVYFEKLAGRFEFRFVDICVQLIRHTHLSENMRGSEVEKPVAEIPSVAQDSKAAGIPKLVTEDFSRIKHFGHIDWANHNKGELFVQGWLAALGDSQIVKVTLTGKGGEERETPFQFSPMDRPDVIEYVRARKCDSHLVNGFRLRISGDGIKTPAACCLSLGNGADLSLQLADPIFLAMTETQRRDFCSNFD